MKNNPDAVNQSRWDKHTKIFTRNKCVTELKILDLIEDKEGFKRMMESPQSVKPHGKGKKKRRR